MPKSEHTEFEQTPEFKNFMQRLEDSAVELNKHSCVKNVNDIIEMGKANEQENIIKILSILTNPVYVLTPSLLDEADILIDVDKFAVILPILTRANTQLNNITQITTKNFLIALFEAYANPPLFSSYKKPPKELKIFAGGYAKRLRKMSGEISLDQCLSTIEKNVELLGDVYNNRTFSLIREYITALNSIAKGITLSQENDETESSQFSTP